METKFALAQLSWMDVEQRLVNDTQIVIPLGATEEHGYLSLCTDTLFVSYVTEQACEQANVLLAPVLPFGCSAFASKFPSSISLRTVTMSSILGDMVRESAHRRTCASETRLGKPVPAHQSHSRCADDRLA